MLLEKISRKSPTIWRYKISLFYLSIFGCVGSSQLCAGFSLWWLLLVRCTGSRHVGSVVVAHGLSCYVASGIFPDQESNPCPLHWQADSQPLHHQGSPNHTFLITHSFFKKEKIIQTRKYFKLKNNKNFFASKFVGCSLNNPQRGNLFF